MNAGIIAMLSIAALVIGIRYRHFFRERKFLSLVNKMVKAGPLVAFNCDQGRVAFTSTDVFNEQWEERTSYLSAALETPCGEKLHVYMTATYPYRRREEAVETIIHALTGVHPREVSREVWRKAEQKIFHKEDRLYVRPRPNPSAPRSVSGPLCFSVASETPEELWEVVGDTIQGAWVKRDAVERGLQLQTSIA